MNNFIKINLLGSPKIIYNNNNITDKLSHKAAGILYFICSNGKTNREKVAYTFWEGSSKDAARYNLRYNLWSMNKIFKNANKEEEPLLEWNKSYLYINKNYDFEIDIKEYNNEIKKDDIDLRSLMRLKSLYKGEFLEGFYLKESFSFNDWIFYEREKYQKKHIKVLKNLLNIYKEQKNYDKAISILEEMLRINSLDEDLYVSLIKIYIEKGDRISALQEYNRCIHVLRQELNISPKESTEKLLKIIKNKSYNKEVTKDINSGDITRLTKDDVDYLENIKDEQYGDILKIKCIPIENLNYCFMASLIDKILDYYDENFLSGARSGIWNDIYRINTRAANFITENFSIDSIETERNRLYYSLLELLFYMSKENKITIIIENLHFMDKYSFDFIKFLLFKNNKMNIDIMFTCNDNDSKLVDIEQYFNISKLLK